MQVRSSNAKYSTDEILATYVYHGTTVHRSEGLTIATPKETTFDFKTQQKVQKTGMMIVG